MLTAKENRRSDNAQQQILRQVAVPVVYSSLPFRFLTKVAFRNNDCWEWKAAVACLTDSRGVKFCYGVYQGHKAHRVSYVAHKGSIPEGCEIDHLCRNKLCVNPDHLEAVTHRENCRRRLSSGPPKGCTWVVIDGKRRMVLP